MVEGICHKCERYDTRKSLTFFLSNAIFLIDVFNVLVIAQTVQIELTVILLESSRVCFKVYARFGKFSWQ